MSAKLYEMIGRKQADLEALHGEYDRLLMLLVQVVEGRVPADTVRVDLQGRRWEVVLPLASQPSGGNGVHPQPAEVIGGHQTPQAE